MEKKLRRPSTLKAQQSARKLEILNSWSLQERARRKRVSKARQLWLAKLLSGETVRQPARVA